MYSCERIKFEKNISSTDFSPNKNIDSRKEFYDENIKSPLIENKETTEKLVNPFNDYKTENKIDIYDDPLLDLLKDSINNPKFFGDKNILTDNLLEFIEKPNLGKKSKIKKDEPISKNYQELSEDSTLLELKSDNDNENKKNSEKFKIDLDKYELKFCDEVSYFNKLYFRLNEYIKMIVLNDFTDDSNIDILDIDKSLKLNNGLISGKKLVIDIVRILNYYYSSNYSDNKNNFYFNFGDEIRFKKFSEYVSHLRKIFFSIRDSYSEFNIRKKKEFLNILILLVDKIIQLSQIKEIEDRKEYNGVNSEVGNGYKVFKRYKNIELDMITVAGKGNIKSFEMSKNVITNYQFLNFVDKGGYFKDSYWSKDGMLWKSYFKLRCPKHWKNIANEWYINNNKLEFFYDLPVEQISYYEAEAFCNFHSCRLPTEEEWNFVSTNRDITKNPYGLYLPCKIDISSDFDNLLSADFGKTSLLGFNQLYGNVWEYTRSINKTNDDVIEVCLKGGDSLFPDFIMNNNLKLYLPRDITGLQTGFRILKSKLF